MPAADTSLPTPATDTPFISVVVLAFNGLDHLRICLPTLLNQTYPADRLEILVVDNASADGTAEMVVRDFPSVRLVRNTANLGFARGNTVGAQAARGEFVAFLNQDTRADRHWLAELIAPIVAARRAGDDHLICTGAKMLSWDGAVIDFAGGRMNAIGKATQIGAGQPDAPAYTVERETLFACGGAMLIDRQVYLAAGGFDDDYFVLFEDVDLGWRLWVLGWRVVLAPKAIVYHRLHASVGEVHDVRKQLIFERNALFSLLKNYDDENLGRAVPVAVLLTLYRVLGELRDAGLQPDDFDIRSPRRVLDDTLPMTAPAAGLLLAIDAVFEHLPGLMAKREAIQSRRRRSDHEIFRLFGGPLEPLDFQPGFAAASYQLSAAFGLDRSFVDVPRHLVIVSPAPPWTAATDSPASMRATTLARAAQAAGHQVTLLCPEAALALGSGDAAPGITVAPWSETAVHALLDRYRPDAILACDPQTAFWIDPASFFRRIPLIVDVGGSPQRGEDDAERAAIALRRADLVICGTERHQAKIESWLRDLGVVAPDHLPRPLLVPFVLPDASPPQLAAPDEPTFVCWLDQTADAAVADLLQGVLAGLNRADRGHLMLMLPQVAGRGSPDAGPATVAATLAGDPRVTVTVGLDWQDGRLQPVAGTIGLDLANGAGARPVTLPIWATLCLWSGLPVLTTPAHPLAADLARDDAGWLVDDAPDALATTVTRLLAEPWEIEAKAAGVRRWAATQPELAASVAAIDAFVRRPDLLIRPSPVATGSAFPLRFTADGDATAPIEPPTTAAQSPAASQPQPAASMTQGGSAMSPAVPDRLSVVVPTYNRPDLLARVLDGLATQTWPRDRFEVIVVDDGGDQPAAAVVDAAQARGLPVVLEWQPNAGPAAARNRGIRRATGQVVVFLDDDCVPTTDWLAQHAHAHAQPHLATIGPIVWHPDVAVTPLLRYAGERALFDFERISVADDAPFSCFYTANAAVDRNLLLAAGLFDESFPRAAWEDTELAYRLRRAGARFVFRRDAVVQHLRGFDLAGFLQRQRAAGYESVRAWAKHPELRTVTGVDVVVGEEVEQRFFESAGRYAWLVGAAEALGGDGPGAAMLAAVSQTTGDTSALDAWRADYIRQRETSMNQELDRRQATINELFGTTDTMQRRLKRAEAELTDLRKRHENLTLAYQSQQAWALDMEERLKLLASHPRLLEKLLGRGR